MNKQIWFHIIIYFYCFCYICPFHNYKSEDSFSLINQTVQTLFMDYENDYILNLINENKNERTVVIHSINCKIAFKDIKPNSSNIILDQKNNDTFSLKIEKNNSEGFLGKIITLKHIKSNEQFEHYKYKECPIMFTNIYHNNETSLFLNDTSTLYFYNNLKEVNLSYYINDLNKEYQYYYMQVSKGEEGELMLHNKRQKGILIAKLVNKNHTTKSFVQKMCLVHEF